MDGVPSNVFQILYNGNKYTLNQDMPSTFIEPFKCGACLGLLYKPVKVCEKAHSFFKECIEKWEKKIKPAQLAGIS